MLSRPRQLACSLAVAPGSVFLFEFALRWRDHGVAGRADLTRGFDLNADSFIPNPQGPQSPFVCRL